MFLLLMISMTLFWVGHHNVDLSHNISLWYNDLNDGAYNLRDYYDCNLAWCPGFATFYMTGMMCMMFAFIALYATILWRELK